MKTFKPWFRFAVSKAHGEIVSEKEGRYFVISAGLKWSPIPSDPYFPSWSQWHALRIHQFILGLTSVFSKCHGRPITMCLFQLNKGSVGTLERAERQVCWFQLVLATKATKDVAVEKLRCIMHWFMMRDASITKPCTVSEDLAEANVLDLLRDAAVLGIL